jgi:DNA mismatch endonuclease (patch repair protein)
MRANRRVSGAEVKFRRALWAAGARGFRRGERLPGRPDVVFPRLRLAVFVHGCYWHRCPTCNLALPKANREFWRAKFAANVSRDRRVANALARTGWDVMVIWEHEIRPDPSSVARRLTAEVNALRQSA